MRKHRQALVVLATVLVCLMVVGGVALASQTTGAPTKQQQLVQQAAATATMAEQGYHAPKVPNRPVSHACPQPLKTGIFPFHIAPNDILHTYHLLNVATVHASAGTWYTILAGAQLTNPSQGVLLVQQVALDPCTDTTRYPVRVYLMSTQNGAITITQVRGDVIGFTTVQGATGTFAYATGQFQS